MFEKLFVIGSLNWISFANGFSFGQITSLISSLHKHEEGIAFSEWEISLIASSFTVTCIIGFGLAAAITDKVGRRWPFIVFSTSTAINWIVLYYAKEMYQFLLSRVIAGTSAGALFVLNIYVPSEYTSPETRSFYLNMITTVAPALGTSAAHAIGVVLQWRIVTLLGILIIAFGMILPYFWVESPHWLASKGKFDECEKTFRILHGLDSERELELLLRMENKKLQKANETNCIPTLKRLLKALKRKYFWQLLMLSVTIQAYFTAAGKLVFSILATVILEDITGSSDVLLFTLLVDAFIFLGSCISCIILRTSMRKLLFSTGFTANGILIVFSVSHYFKQSQAYFDWINVALLALYFIIVNAGPYPVLEAILSEIFPLELKVYMFCISGTILVSSSTLSVILSPIMVSSVGYHGIFLINAAIMSVCLSYIWLILPETKGRTLQEIEIYFKTENFDIDEVLSRDQARALL